MIPNSERAERDPIEIVSYDNEWPNRFAGWKGKLLVSLEAPPRRIEHVGSTAVPGLAAKDVIDIQVSVDSLQEESRYVPAIESLGVQFRSRDDQHRFFRPFSGRLRDVQIHVCGVGSEWEYRHLLFRDYLRANSAAREAYARAKDAAAIRWRQDRIAYAYAKTEVIERLMAEAKVWAGNNGWSIDRSPSPA